MCFTANSLTVLILSSHARNDLLSAYHLLVLNWYMTVNDIWVDKMMRLYLKDVRSSQTLTLTPHPLTGESNIWSKDAQSLQKPSGVTCDSSGHIFVVESRGLLAFSSDGQIGRALVKPGDGILDDPRGVALDSEGLMYVTSHDDEIKVLRLV